MRLNTTGGEFDTHFDSAAFYQVTDGVFYDGFELQDTSAWSSTSE